MLTGCAGRQAARGVQCNVHIGGSVLTIAAEKRFAYREAIDAACRGEEAALVNLLVFTEQTDGEAMLDHANVLRALRDHLGADRFDNVSQSLGIGRQKNIDALIRTAEKLHEATLGLRR